MDELKAAATGDLEHLDGIAPLDHPGQGLFGLDDRLHPALLAEAGEDEALWVAPEGEDLVAQEPASEGVEHQRAA